MGPHLKLVSNNFVVKRLKHVGWRTILGAFELTARGKFEVQIVKSRRFEIMVGVSRAENDLTNYFTINDMGWGLYLRYGKAYSRDEGHIVEFLHGRHFHNGDRIGVSVDRSMGTMYFSLNGEGLAVHSL